MYTAGEFDASAAAVVTLSAASTATSAFCSAASYVSGLPLKFLLMDALFLFIGLLSVDRF